MSRASGFHPATLPATQWSMVLRAAADKSPFHRQALGYFLRHCLPALRAHLVLAKGITPQQADDLLGGFISVAILSQNLLSHARQQRGRFRTLLLTALDRHALGRLSVATICRRLIWVVEQDWVEDSLGALLSEGLARSRGSG